MVVAYAEELDLVDEAIAGGLVPAEEAVENGVCDTDKGREEGQKVRSCGSPAGRHGRQTQQADTAEDSGCGNVDTRQNTNRACGPSSVAEVLTTTSACPCLA